MIALTPVFAAASDLGAVILQGTSVTTFAPPGTSCSAIAAPSHSLQVAGFSNGSLYSFDGTTWAARYTFPASPTAIFVNSNLSWRWSVGLSNGDIWRSFDSGITWWPIATLNSSITQLQETPDGQQTYVAIGRQVLGLSGQLVVIQAAFPVFCFVLDPVGLFAGGIGAITNGTTTWSITGDARSLLALSRDVHIAATSTGRLYLRRADGTWSAVGTPAPGGTATAAALHGRVILSASAQWLSLSADLGATWRTLRRGFFTSVATALPQTQTS